MKSNHKLEPALLATKDSLKDLINVYGEKNYRVNQIFTGLYDNFFCDWDEFSSLPKGLREKLQQVLFIRSLTLVETVVSNNRNVFKYLFETIDGYPLESVLMENQDRHTLCVSTQSGCGMKCSFCATGALGFNRDLKVCEILEQVYLAQRYLKLNGETLSNIVFMGMGEPFNNYENVMQAIHLLNDPQRFNIGARRITISTIGLLNKLQKFLNEDIQVNLALSLHAPNNPLRNTLVPSNKANPIESIISTLNSYIKKTHRRVSIEYVLIRNINDSPKHAEELAGLLSNNLYHVNLIPLNPTTTFNHSSPTAKTIQKFAQIIRESSIPVSVRKSQGEDILAGCGQLAGKRGNEVLNTLSKITH